MLSKDKYSFLEPDGAVHFLTYNGEPVKGFNGVLDFSAPAIIEAAVALGSKVAAVAPAGFYG